MWSFAVKDHGESVVLKVMAGSVKSPVSSAAISWISSEK